MKFKLNDTVIITRGKDANKQGKITKVLPKISAVVVEGVGVYHRHLKPTQTGSAGKIVDRHRPLPLAKIALVCPHCKKPTRIGYLIDKQGSKTRICRKCNKAL